MHKSAMKCNETIGKWCKNKHGASKIIDTFGTYQRQWRNYGTLSGNLPTPLGFFVLRLYIGEGASSGGCQGTLTHRGMASAWAVPPWCVGPSWPHSASSSVLWKLRWNAGWLALVSSNSENIFRVTFLKHKNSRKQGTGTVASYQ
jgi:hypothetical protein